MSYISRDELLRIIMKIPSFFKKKDDGMFYEISLNDDRDAVRKADFFDAIRLARTEKRADELYDTDPNKLDVKEVSQIFSSVLRSLDGFKQLQSAS